MRWSWKIARFAGIGVYVHATFVLLLLVVAWSGFVVRGTWIGALHEVLVIVCLFGLVVLHEFGHALMARRFGIATKDITLLPIGGVARLERMPEEPWREIAVALAGPAVNVVLAILFGAILWALHPGESLAQMEATGGLLFQLTVLNIVLFTFNLLPAFPMDGGRVLRALLALRLNYARATAIAARIGQGLAVLIGMAGLMGWLGSFNPLLVLLALFVWMGAAQESNMVQLKHALGGTRVSQIMITDFRTLSPEDPLSRAVEHLLSGYQDDFPVVVEGRVVGLLTRGTLVESLSKMGSSHPVAAAMRHTFPTVGPDEPAESVFMRFQSSTCRSIPVVLDGRLIGMITAENVSEFLMVQSALRAEPSVRDARAVPQAVPPRISGS
jgi:Zn-dependent proteases